VSRPSDSSRPSFAAGCRWGNHGEDRVVLFPEGMIRVHATGLSILELVDGQRDVAHIISSLAERYLAGGPYKNPRRRAELSRKAARQTRGGFLK
jgi:hypothetical protein